MASPGALIRCSAVLEIFHFMGNVNHSFTPTPAPLYWPPLSCKGSEHASLQPLFFLYQLTINQANTGTVYSPFIYCCKHVDFELLVYSSRRYQFSFTPSTAFSSLINAPDSHQIIESRPTSAQPAET
ncbi:hypothetical protein I7I50_04412 [Histoplasma capsulatum G186AR]|uniref:Uncharacterized protein n=1 Tax=Ajellomyces capsulatus TaxID=5037 RepID=A0A8H7YPI8_AJECA|nr:hypothetical protein I7I52_05320 [Histoplasma capsulatum]QSS75310.1 hypothetical protein I7I50_04412 [Histoplasma capsulatum G186AR]